MVRRSAPVGRLLAGRTMPTLRTPTHRLRRGVASSSVIGFGAYRVARFAPPIPSYDATVFRRGSFGLDLSFGAAWEAHGFRSARPPSGC